MPCRRIEGGVSISRGGNCGEDPGCSSFDLLRFLANNMCVYVAYMKQ